jgi:hypothetical protein
VTRLTRSGRMVGEEYVASWAAYPTTSGEYGRRPGSAAGNVHHVDAAVGQRRQQRSNHCGG